MANEVRIASSLTPVKEVDVTEGGNLYDLSAIDTNALRSFGGKYNTLTAYGDGAIARYTNAVVAENNTWDGLDVSGWQKGAGGPDDGTLPTTVYAIAIEYVSELGTVGNVDVRLSKGGQTIEICSLDLDEGQVIPIAEGIALTGIELRADVYLVDVNEATINLLVIGV